eukprot:TRINITY_DN1886_c0_g2_i2.p1 TRINITY_DN1886_c0_g2~~TRINITY_DN1886_c0_g2_i2.p1  ORF type:complete len:345 (-),score=25.23 TRINITY_DN1886_c0_g2_i2:1006-2040(-)
MGIVIGFARWSQGTLPLVLVILAFINGVMTDPPAYPERNCEAWLREPPVDCLRHTEADCVAAGCYWIANFPGPWCQFKMPTRCHPYRLKLAYDFVVNEISNLSSTQLTAGLIGCVALTIQIVLMLWARKQERLNIKKEVNKKDDLEDILIEEYNINRLDLTSKNPTMVRRRTRSPTDLETEYEELPHAPQNLSIYKKILKWLWIDHRLDVICSSVLFGLSLWIHLWRLEIPPVLTYDECHFGYFTSKYFKREYLFDIHPPLAKIMFYILGSLLGHDPGPGANFQFKGQMGTPYHNWYQFYPLRFLASFWGALVVPVMYLTCRSLKVSAPVSIFGASLYCGTRCC